MDYRELDDRDLQDLILYYSGKHVLTDLEAAIFTDVQEELEKRFSKIPEKGIDKGI